MITCDRFYIDGRWVEPQGSATLPIVDPAAERVFGSVTLGSGHDAEQAVAAARRAFDAGKPAGRQERLDLLHSVISVLEKREDDLAEAITREMGAPLAAVSRPMQAPLAAKHFRAAAHALSTFEFERRQGTTLVVREPVGVCTLITAWNWPALLIACKVAPALAAGCTMVLKPSELAPLSARVLAEVLHEAGAPAGVFNLVQGDGPGVGAALASHPDVDMVSITGSTRAGIQVVKTAADTMKKVTAELGGKSACIVTEDANLEKAVRHCVTALMRNSGQSCNAPSRLLVPQKLLAQAERLAADVANGLVIGDPHDPATQMGPLASAAQFERVQSMIERGLAQGARLVCGGPGRPGHLVRGFYARPTVFGDVTMSMDIARQEIFGPVLCMLGYRDIDEAVALANDTVYGLSGFVHAATQEAARGIAMRLRTGTVSLNGASSDLFAPFGGYRQSGIGREWGVAGLEEFLETKAVYGDQSGAIDLTGGR